MEALMEVVIENSASSSPKRRASKNTKARSQKSVAKSSPTSTLSDSKRSKSVSLRIDNETQCLIDRAAESLGQSRTDFMLSTAREKAVEVLLDKKMFVLQEADWNSFLSVLDEPPPANEKLKSILSSTPPWENQTP
jgi:uncharacterized protein (DUF1778 family)